MVTCFKLLIPAMAFWIQQAIFCLLAAFAQAGHFSECKAWLVQSIPTDMPHLRRVPGVLDTGDVLQWLAGNATQGLDIMAQYWQLIAQPENPSSGDYGYGEAQMRRFGAPNGEAVFDALEAAAGRGIPIRIVQHSGFFPDYDEESAKLASGRPNVQNRTLQLGNWWGTGIVHTKVWISDKKHVYIGSANNDWKSLTQVKELGIYISDCPETAERVELYFNNMWSLTSLNASDFTRTMFDEEWQINRTVPCWSHFLRPERRCKAPMHSVKYMPEELGYSYMKYSSFFDLKLDTPGISSSSDYSPAYMTFAPPEIAPSGYASDEQGWVDTILSTTYGGILRISTMDWLGQSQFTDTPVYWAALSSAISKLCLSKHVKIRLLVARWLHSIDGTDEYLSSLDYTNTLCSSTKFNNCSGRVEIKYYEVPGFNKSGPAVKSGKPTDYSYPGYTRVNHGKYTVSDLRAHIGTSNLVWDYFYATAGMSFGSYNPNIVAQLQQVFDADWFSPYAVPFSPQMFRHFY